MKTKEEIEKLAKEYANGKTSSDVRKNDFIKGYTQCQEYMAEFIRAEIRRAFIHGQGNGQMMEVGLERDEIDDYINSRMRTLNKQD